MSNTYCKPYVLQRFVPSWLVSHPFCVIHFCAPLLPFIAIKTNVNPILIICTTPSQVNQYLQTGQTQEIDSNHSNFKVCCKAAYHQSNPASSGKSGKTLRNSDKQKHNVA